MVASEELEIDNLALARRKIISTRVLMNLPELFLEFLKENGFSANIYDPSRPLKRYFAVNPLHSVTEAEIISDFPRGCIKCEEFDLFFELLGENPSNVFARSKLYREGKILPMELSSGLAVKYLDPRPGEHILDLCCAPGTKMTLSSLISVCQASFTGVDISKQRLATARSLVKKYRLGLVRLVHADGRNFDRRPFVIDPDGGEVEANCFYSSTIYRNRKGIYDPERLYDKVIVDAQCTHDGSVKHILKNNENGWSEADITQYTAENLKNLEELQLALLENGFRLCKSSGFVLYCTCSLSFRQNEQLVAKFLSSNPSALLISLFDDTPESMKRFDPAVSGGSGFFIAKIMKK